ncbi:MAG: 16S rRNA (guanine(966)-N(2))-methyltransferase RsmD [Deltaproteobacteria bacterium]|nr:16S rRNA (guanine(966)-N(2))-methyltransferase RsmD [Deltaproteobacteria bacterium]
MRITGGEARGRILASLKGSKIRPTSDRVREAIFSLIGQDTAGLSVLDLFAGTGCLGIEAISRGAIEALFVDNSFQSIKLIKKNLHLCRYESVGSVLKRDLSQGFPGVSPLIKEKFDLVFIDPPYKEKVIPQVLTDLSVRDTLSLSAIVVAESFKADTMPVTLGKLYLDRSKTYGQTKISIYRCGGNL